MWIAFDKIGHGFEFCKTEEEAKKMAQQNVNYELEEDNLWFPDMEGAIGYAKIVQATKKKVVGGPGRDDRMLTFELVPVD